MPLQILEVMQIVAQAYLAICVHLASVRTGAVGLTFLSTSEKDA